MLRRLAVGLVAAALAISQAGAGESHAAAAAGTWTWAAAAGDGVLLVGAPRAEARPGRPVEPPAPARLVWAPPASPRALVPPLAVPRIFAEPAARAPATVVASGRGARGPPGLPDR
jgi:hypothetical protein